MAASGYSTISLYYSTTASAVPVNTNLVSGELALNITDGKLYYKDNAGTVQLLSTSTTANGTANGVLYLNGSKVATSGSALTFDGTTLNASTTSPIIRATASTTNALYGFELNGGALDAFVKAQPNTAELRISSGRSAGWGGFTSFYIDTSEAMRLTSTGLGIGTSSPAAKLQVGNGTGTPQAFISGSGYDLYAGASGGTIFGYASGTISTVFNTASVPLGIGTNASQPLVFGTVGTERARIDSSGNLGLGVTPSAWGGSGYKAFQLGQSAFFSRPLGSDSYLLTNCYYNGTNFIYNQTAPASYYRQDQASHAWFTAPSGTAGNAITFTQAMTLDSSGNLLVGTTSVLLAAKISSIGGASQNGGAFQTTASANNYTAIAGARDGNAGNVAEWWYNSTTQVGTISVTSTATAYNTSSDYRLKNIDGPLTGSGAFIDALKPKVGTWKADGSRFVGFLAHEVQEVSPASVTGQKDGEKMQAMEYGSAEFIANIIAELQSLRARVAALEN